MAQKRAPEGADGGGRPETERSRVRGFAEARVLTVGTRLGRYELLHPIASGGMAQVWAAEQTGDLGFRKLIALKTILPQYAFDASFRAMFLDEAQLAARIRHVNVVEIQDLGAEGHTVFQAMTLIEGAALSEWVIRLDGERLPLGVALRITVDMLRGLHAAHELCDDDGVALGLVHRDVSPHNVLVGSDGVAKLADFGIAKAFGRTSEETYAGDLKGKLAYLSPEQLAGLPAAPQSDIFAAGVVLWEIATGRRLFKMGRSEASTSARRRMTVRDPRIEVPDLPEPVARVAMRALEADPFARFSTALEMADALEEAVRSLGLDATHRHVAARLEHDLGPRIRAQREALRAAQKARGSGASFTPARAPDATEMVTATQTPTEPDESTLARTAMEQPETRLAFPAGVQGSRWRAPVVGYLASALALAAIGVALGVGALGRERRAPQAVAATSAPSAENVEVVDPPGAAAAEVAPSLEVETDAPGEEKAPTPAARTAPRKATPARAPRPRATATTTATTGAVKPRFDSPYGK